MFVDINIGGDESEIENFDFTPPNQHIYTNIRQKSESEIDFSSELEINEWLDIGGLDLDDYPRHDDDEERLEREWQNGDNATRHIAPALREEMKYIAEEHENGYSGIACHPLDEDHRLEVGEYLMEHCHGCVVGLGTEWYPNGGYKMEGEDTSPPFPKGCGHTVGGR